MIRRPKLYSKHGCVTCKQRKKKCDELRPSCSACTRLKFICSYDNDDDHYRTNSFHRIRGAVSIGPIDLPSATYQAQAIRTHKVHNITEQNILQDIPKKLPLFWASTSSEASRNLQVFQQMVAQHDLVRSAVIACFSEFLGSGEKVTTVKYKAFGRTLQLLQAKLNNKEYDRQETMQVKMAMNFMGMMEAISPGESVDLLEHWKGVTAFTLCWKQTGMHQWRFLPRNEYILCQESLLFHVSILAMFSHEPEYIHSIYRDSNVSIELEALNPEGPDRVSNSILLSGQYILFEMALEVTHRFRWSGGMGVPEEDLEEMMAVVSVKQGALERDFGLLAGPSPEKRLKIALCKAYNLFCSALQICIHTLSAPSSRQVECVDRLASESLKEFRRLWEMLEGVRAAQCAHVLWMSLWPFQILACAIRQQSDFEVLADRFKTLSRSLDEGTRVRTEALFDQIRGLSNGSTERDSHDCDAGNSLPIGLSLLRKPQGLMA